MADSPVASTSSIPDSPSPPVAPSPPAPAADTSDTIAEVTPLRTSDGDDEAKPIIDDNLPIKLTSSDEKEFTVPYKTISKSILIKNLLDDVGAESDEPIPLPNVTSETLQKVLDWCEYHVNDPEPFVDDFEDEFTTRRSVTICDWDREFYEVPQDQLFDIILAANYLDIKLLLDVGCKTVANMIKGKTPQEIRDTFGIENDFTPEEEEAIRRENEWAEER